MSADANSWSLYEPNFLPIHVHLFKITKFINHPDSSAEKLLCNRRKIAIQTSSIENFTKKIDVKLNLCKYQIFIYHKKRRRSASASTVKSKTNNVI
jgi:hypothetical protein